MTGSGFIVLVPEKSRTRIRCPTTFVSEALELRGSTLKVRDTFLTLGISKVSEPRYSEILKSSMVTMNFINNREDVAGFVVTPEPIDLIEFAKHREEIEPDGLLDAIPIDLGDAMMMVASRLKQIQSESKTVFVHNIHGMTLRFAAWSNRQLFRMEAMEGKVDAVDTDEVYKYVQKLTPITRTYKRADGKEFTMFTPSYFRTFVANNLIRGAPWHDGFKDYHAVLERFNIEKQHATL